MIHTYSTGKIAIQFYCYQCTNDRTAIQILVYAMQPLCWFQTSLLLAALPLYRMIIACCFRVTALSGHVALALSPSGIASELNRIQLSAVCCCGHRGGIINLLARRCLPLSIGLPSAASGTCAVVQKLPSLRQAAS